MAANNRFIYDEKSSKLYAPDGRFLKHVYCPKAKNWNQLIVEDGEDRWRGCDDCQEKVLNLDVADASEVLEVINNSPYQDAWEHVCIYATAASNKVIFLVDRDAPLLPSTTPPDDDSIIQIQTARTIEDINRAISMGYKADIRHIEYDTKNIKKRIQIRQDIDTGRVFLIQHFGYSYTMTPMGYEILKILDSYYPNYQQIPLAAYLIPNKIVDGTKVRIIDPIEDFKGNGRYGDTLRAKNLPGTIEKGRVVIDLPALDPMPNAMG